MPVPFKGAPLAGFTAADLRAVVHYDPETGLFTRSSGEPAGGPHNAGYVRIHVKGQRYLAHRLAWLYMTGEWPIQEIDHINGNRADNRWANLRDTDSVGNNRNRHDYQPNKGTCYHAPTNKWNARIKVHGRHRSLGYFHSREDAHAAYVRAAREVFGAFAAIPDDVAA